MYIGWATNVNKDILDSTSITVGEGATVEDSLETGGQKKKRLARATPSDKYSVTQKFDCITKGTDGYTEVERFWIWYKYVHCYGVNPFSFPAILINSNRQQGNSQEEYENILARIRNGDPTAKLPDNEYYVISNATEGNKVGNDIEIKMTWETYATGAFTIPDDESEIDHITAHNGYVDIVQTSTPTVEPTSETWVVNINSAQETILACVFDGDVTTRYYFTPKTTAGTYVVTIAGKLSTFTVA